MILTMGNRFIEQKGYLDEGHGKPDQQLFDLAEQARDRAEYGRKSTGMRDIGAEIRKKYDNAVWEKQPKNNNGELDKNAPLVDEGLVKERMAIPAGGVGGWPTCDLVVAKESVDAQETDAGRAPMNLKRDFIAPWEKKKKSHALNIEALKEAKTKISGCPA